VTTAEAREKGKMGGESTRDRYGRPHYERLGAMGGVLVRDRADAAMPEMRPEFAGRLREMRIAVGMTQADLARRVRLARNTISSWELGDRPQRMRDVRMVAQALGVPAGWLMFGGNPIIKDPICCPLCGGRGVLSL
jgi:DNA-binding XRE family transcriptional regulator